MSRSHFYPAKISPEIEVGRCDKPAFFVEVKEGNRVESFCEDRHLIKGKIYPSYERAAAIAQRLARWIDPTRCPCMVNQYGIIVEYSKKCHKHSRLIHE